MNQYQFKRIYHPTLGKYCTYIKDPETGTCAYIPESFSITEYEALRKMEITVPRKGFLGWLGFTHTINNQALADSYRNECAEADMKKLMQIISQFKGSSQNGST